MQVPPDYASGMVPFDSPDEFRPHHAGFLEPRFNYAGPGAPARAVLEVRSREVPLAQDLKPSKHFRV